MTNLVPAQHGICCPGCGLYWIHEESDVSSQDWWMCSTHLSVGHTVKESLRHVWIPEVSTTAVYRIDE